MSYLEIYNENIKDLLDSKRKTLRIIEDARGVWVSNLTEIKIKNLSEMNKLLEKGNSARAVAETGFNKESSRSHAVIQITVKREKTVSKLTLVDLAGSERIGTNVRL